MSFKFGLSHVIFDRRGQGQDVRIRVLPGVLSEKHVEVLQWLDEVDIAAVAVFNWLAE